MSLDPSVDDALSLGSPDAGEPADDSSAAVESDVEGDTVALADVDGFAAAVVDTAVAEAAVVDDHIAVVDAGVADDVVNASVDDVAVDDVAVDDVAVDDVAVVDVVVDEVAPPAAELDPLAAEAVELARAAASEVGGTDVGDHLGMSSEGAGVVTHVFAATLPGYRGWRWVVTVARAPGTSVVTVDEVVLLPGAEALRAPEWIPWAQRIRPGDLGAGDLLPADPDDSRLVPSFWSDGDPAVEDADDQVRVVADEVGLGRVRVLSRDGRVDSAERWVEGDFGPESPTAKQAPAQCGTCGFLVLVRGSLGAAFGICANEYSSADAHVVSIDFGCGAHSEAGVDLASRSEPSGDVYDSGELVIEANEA